MIKTDRTLTQADTRLDSIDSFRGLAILGVLLVHAALISRQTGALAGLGLLGYRGVQLFYIVSAFTLFRSLDSDRIEKHKWSNFFIRRFFRIAPLFYLAAVGNLVLHRNTELSRGQILSGFVFMNGLSPRAINRVTGGGWSVAVETMFYMLLPALFLIIRNLRSAVAAFVLSTVALGSLSFYLANLPQFSGYDTEIYFRLYWFPVELPVFLLGPIAYFIWKRSHWYRSVDPVLAVAVCAVLGFMGLSVPRWGLYLSCIPFVGLIVVLLANPWPLLVNGFTRFMGRISYSMYLVHFFVLYGIERMHIQPPPTASGFVEAYLLILLMSIPICIFTFKYVEQFGIDLARVWIKAREA